MRSLLTHLHVANKQVVLFLNRFSKRWPSQTGNGIKLRQVKVRRAGHPVQGKNGKTGRTRHQHLGLISSARQCPGS